LVIGPVLIANSAPTACPATLKMWALALPGQFEPDVSIYAATNPPPVRPVIEWKSWNTAA